ncbi:MAG: hypothetical protein IPF62_17060 [Bacteroidetes bacterium]|nr:hypothetical protein [Bacteroidota bacterium]
MYKALLGGAQGATTVPQGFAFDQFTVLIDTGQFVPGISATLVGTP